MGGEELKWHQLAHYQLISQQGPHSSPHSTVKTDDKFLWKNGLYGLSDVVIYSEKTHLKKLRS